MKKIYFLFLLATLVIACTPEAGLYPKAKGPFTTIARKGAPAAQIIIPVQATELERFAASELSKYIGLISGAELPVISENDKPGHKYSFYIGKTGKASAEGTAPGKQNMGRDGFEIRSVNDGIIIHGINELSPVFGVYELLERYFDVRWFMPGKEGEYYPVKTTLKIGKADLIYKPDFSVRWVGTGEWALHNRMNAYIKAGEKNLGINWKWHFHTFVTLIPPDKYHKEHPEYFALVKGERKVTDSKTHENQLCTSNPSVIKEVAKNLIDTLDSQPGIEIITLSPNDGGGFCECEKCTALDEPGSDWFSLYSNRLAVFNNEVAKLVKEKHPDVLIKVGAYAMYARPPKDPSFKPEDNLFFQFCHLYFCHNHPLGSNKCQEGVTYEKNERYLPNQDFEKMLDQWGKLSPHLFIYEYYSVNGMNRGGLPWPLVHAIRTDIPFYRDKGVEGFYTQLASDLFYKLGLNYYVASKLCWNPDLDADALINDYFEKLYGPAAEYAMEFYMTMEKSMEDWNGCASYGLQGVDGLKRIGINVFTPEVMQKLNECVTSAESVTAGDKVYSERAAMLRRTYDETEASMKKIIEQYKDKG